MGADILFAFRKRLRRWLGIAAIQRQVRDLEIAQKTLRSDLEAGMALNKEDVERLNAATSRIAARFASLLDTIDQLGTGNDDEVRAQAKLEAAQEASTELRPLVEQLEALGADATQIVPEPTPEQVPVAPGPDVAPVENLPGAPSETVGGESQPGPTQPGDVVTPDPALSPGAVDTETPVTPPEHLAATQERPAE